MENEFYRPFRFVRGITADPYVCDLQVDVATPGYVLPRRVTVDVNNNRYVNIAAGDQCNAPMWQLSTFGLNAPTTEVGKQNIIRSWDYFSSILGQDINEEKYLGNILSICKW
jgi:hypothetical protein